MNYPESTEIKALIDKSQKILLNCHRNPDSDSVGSSTALSLYLQSIGKETKTLVPDDVPQNLSFFTKGIDIQTVDFDSFNFKDYDLFIFTDTSSWDRVFESKDIQSIPIPSIVIDNHKTNKGFGELNLLDFETSSACEMIYNIFQDWGVTITKEIATVLLAGIVGDTGSFQYEIYKYTFDIADKLINIGADLNAVTFHLFRSVEFELIKFWGLVISSTKIDETGFAYAAIPFKEYEPYLHLKGTKSTAVGVIIRNILNTKFGFVMTEDEPGVFSVSFRARESVDISGIAVSLGGGGHAGAAAAGFSAGNFDEALSRVLALSRAVAQN